MPNSASAQRLLLSTPAPFAVGDPARGRSGARLAAPALRRLLQGADIVIVVAGLGGGTGSGAAPVIARLARDAGALTLAIVAQPFAAEEAARHAAAAESLERLHGVVDALLPLDSDALHATPEARAMSVAHLLETLLSQTIEALSGVVNSPGLINVDFADLRAVLSLGGGALVATGCGAGEAAALQAAAAAARSHLLNAKVDGATGMIVQISGGPALSLQSVNQVMGHLRARAADDALLVMGTELDYGLGEAIRVTVIATGIGSRQQRVAQRPQLRALDAPAVMTHRPVAPSPRPPAPEGYGLPAWLRQPQPLPVS